MSIKEIAYRIIRTAVLMGISFFFLLPFFSPLRSPLKSMLFKHENLPVAKLIRHSDQHWDQKPVIYTPENLGINLPWLDLHNGKSVINWLNTAYNATLIDNDLSEIQSMGVTKVRSFCQMESVFNFKDGRFILNQRYAKNLDDFLSRAQKHGISVVCVMGDGNYEGQPQDLDGHLRWDLIQKPEGLQAYKDAYISYINHFKNHTNILMWDMVNEPYGSITWSFSAKALKVTPQLVHAFLLQSYKAIKPLGGTTPVGFSDVEEEQQQMYQLFSDPQKRKTLVDDCTDIYAMHIYRATASQVADFRSLTGKPKWALELGDYNYDDPDAKEHPIPAANELYNTDENYIAVTQISPKLLNSGFSLIMPWAFAANDGMVKHNPDGSHTLLKLALFMKEQLLNYEHAKK